MGNLRFKFRAWEKTSKEMVYDVQNVSRKRIIGESACESFQEVIESWEYEIMQYTGIKIDNQDLYEHDIVQDFINNKRYEVIRDKYGVMWLFNPVGTEGEAIDYYEFEDKASSGTIIVGIDTKTRNCWRERNERCITRNKGLSRID